MMKFSRLMTAALLGGALLSASAMAAGTPDVIGTWVMDLDASKSEAPLPKAYALTVNSASADEVSWSITGTGPDGNSLDQSATEKVGKPNVSEGATTLLEWTDKGYRRTVTVADGRKGVLDCTVVGDVSTCSDTIIGADGKVMREATTIFRRQ